MKVADVMTNDLVTCRADDSLNRAAQLMWDRRCGTVAVVDDAGKAVGVLTDRDVCMAAYTQGRRLDDVAVASAMSRAVRTIRASAEIEDAEDVMAAHAVRRVVVVGDDARACGMLSIDDIARSGAEWDGKGENRSRTGRADAGRDLATQRGRRRRDAGRTDARDRHQ